MSSELLKQLIAVTSKLDQEENLQCDLQTRKRKRATSDGAGPPQKRSTNDDGDKPEKRRCLEKKRCGGLADPSEHSRVHVGKRKAGDEGDAPEKKKKCSESTTSGSFITVSSNAGISIELLTDVSPVDTGDDSSQSCHSLKSQEERIYEMSSSGKTSRADFESRYRQLGQIGAGGFGSVYEGHRASDLLPVAIKHIPRRLVTFRRMGLNGKVYNIIAEVAFMLKATGLPGLPGQSAAVSLLDWYLLEDELILVMERPLCCKDLKRHLQGRGGSLSEEEAKVILKQLVDAAIDLHSKGVFHRDIKMKNVLVQMDSDVPRVRIIDFGCGTFSTDEAFHYISGTRAYFPPEWYDLKTYWAPSTSVWQLGAIFYSLLRGHGPFNTVEYMNECIEVNCELSAEVRSLLRLCLVLNPAERATLEDLQRHPALRYVRRPPTPPSV